MGTTAAATATDIHRGADLRAKFQNVRVALCAILVERDSVVDAMLAALLCGEHLILLGPAGCGKSALARALCGAIDNATYFEWLLGRFSVPEEVLGGLSLKALEEGRYQRVTTGKLPEAHVAFLDEIFKANTSILNALLGILNERIFHDGAAPVKCPLLSCIGASNEMPEDGLTALFDRFLLRFSLDYISDRDALANMLTSADPTPPTGMLTIDEVHQAQQQAAAVSFPDAALNTLLDIKASLERVGITCSDRRWKRAAKLLRAVAWLNGDSAVTEDHMDALVDALWREPKERSLVATTISSVANPLAAQALEILDAAREAFTAAMKLIADSKDPKSHATLIAGLSEANGILGQSVKKLEALGGEGGRRRKVDEAIEQVSKMHADIGRRCAKALGISV